MNEERQSQTKGMQQGDKSKQKSAKVIRCETALLANPGESEDELRCRHDKRRRKLPQRKALSCKAV